MKIKNIEIDINHHNLYGLFNLKNEQLKISSIKKTIDLIIKNKKSHYINVYEQIFNQKINVSTYKIFSHKFRYHMYYIANNSNIQEEYIETIVIDLLLEKIDVEFQRFITSLNHKFFIFKNDQFSSIIKKKKNYYVWEDVKKDFYFHFVKMGLVMMPVDSDIKKKRFFSQKLMLNKEFQLLLNKKEANLSELIEYIKNQRIFFSFDKK